MPTSLTRRNALLGVAFACAAAIAVASSEHSQDGAERPGLSTSKSAPKQQTRQTAAQTHAQTAANRPLKPDSTSGVREGKGNAESNARPSSDPGCSHDHPWLRLGTIALRDARYQARLDDGRIAVLTLEPNLQAAAESSLARAKALRGAIVVTDTAGRVLALAGRQAADEASAGNNASGADGKPAPQLATQVWAPAASVFKVVTAAALVDAGVSVNKRVCYHGGVRSVLPSNLSDSKKRDKRCNTLGYALAKSQNAIIAKLAHQHLDGAALRRTAAAFGMTRAPEFCARTEANRASIPDAGIELARVAAGFWNTEMSPLGGAIVANTIASGGLAVRPRLIDYIVEADGTHTQPAVHQPTRAISENVARAIARQLKGTVERGTAYKGFHDKRRRPYLTGLDVAGKTGTLTRKSPYLQYSWFVGFAPVDQPEIVISVLLGNPPKWHLKAHTAARLVLQKSALATRARSKAKPSVGPTIRASHPRRARAKGHKRRQVKRPKSRGKQRKR